MQNPPLYGYVLWFFLVLFSFRVIGQVIVVLFHPSCLPPMPQWYSGLLPYRFLLPTQITLILLMGAMAYDFTQNEGFFVMPRPSMGQRVVWFSFVYFGSMVMRYIIRMKRHPDQRWLGGTIPIIFHCVLAGFLYTFGAYHARFLSQ